MYRFLGADFMQGFILAENEQKPKMVSVQPPNSTDKQSMPLVLNGVDIFF